jgi:hypothetical protein
MKWSTSTTPNSGANTEPISNRKFWYWAKGASKAIRCRSPRWPSARCSTFQRNRIPLETAAE